MSTRKSSMIPLFSLLLLATCLAGGSAQASKPVPPPVAPLKAEDVPAPLKPWVDWVLQNDRDKTCPFLYNIRQHRCAWPDRLQLDIGKRGGDFSQAWLVLEKSWLQLPGDNKLWPRQVKANGQALVVVAHNGQPTVYLDKGYWRIEGRFDWPRMPESLPVPRDSALISLKVNGKRVDFPRFESGGRLWLQSVGGPVKVEDRHELEVFRHVDDGIPAQVTVHLDLNVAGRARELHLPNPFDDKFIPLSLISPLPARIDTDGSLRIQVRPGRWVVRYSARHKTPMSALPFKAPATDWVDEEVWVFQARPDLRIVDVEGVAPTDPNQTSLPNEWKKLPAFAMQSGDEMRFTEKQRGDPEPAPDQLRLHRSLWLSFEGDEFAISDTITGSKTTGWRLEMPAPFQLGRVAVDGEQQFITRLPDSDRAGVELRQGRLSLDADSQLVNDGSAFSAVGWDQDFTDVRATLNLPPGWHLFAATGVDRVQRTWLNQWTLLDMFLVLIIAAAIGRLWGVRLGVVGLLALTLSYHEPGAPQWIWILLIAAFALLRVLPGGRAQTLVTWTRNGLLLLLLIIVIPYFIDEVRKGIYPQLDLAWGQYQGGQQMMQLAKQKPAAPVERRRMGTEVMVEEQPAPEPMLEGLADGEIADQDMPFETREEKSYYSLSSRKKAPRYEPGALLQTGPGLPDWQWRQVQLRWNGPVDRDQQLSLYLIGPGSSFVLALLRVLLLTVLILGIVGMRYSRPGGLALPPIKSLLPVLMLGFATLFVTPETARAEFPNQQMLGELRQRLLARPVCLPECAALESLKLKATPSRLDLELQLHSLDDVAVPLPGNRHQWLPSTVTRNGKVVQGLFTDTAGSLWLRLPPGRHAIHLSGPLPVRDEVQIPLPLRPHRAVLSVSGWEADGVHEDGRTDAQIRLNRTAEAGKDAATTGLDGINMPPFVIVERSLQLGLTWRVHTRVYRASRDAGAVVLQIPLLAGESVISEDVRVRDNKVQLSLGRGVRQLQWSSVLDPEKQLTDGQQTTILLAASDTHEWVEHWSVDVSPVWHMQSEGLVPIHHRQGDQWLPRWRPWPGEQLSLHVSRPVGVDGQTMTLDRSRLQVRPGLRISMADLSLRIRSSQGGRHGIDLPPGSELQEVKVNGQLRPLRLEEGKLYLPVSPGEQTYELSWRYKDPIALFFGAPRVDLNMPGVNNEVSIQTGGERWILFTGGAMLGPAVLIWGILIVLLFVSYGLGRLRELTPLRFYHWFLLFLGLTQVPIEASVFVVGWVFALAARKRMETDIKPVTFNALQIALAALTVISLGVLVAGISIGLLGSPDMQIAGNGSSSWVLKWYQDSVSGPMPEAWVISLPMFVYRIAMLLWALWIAFSLLSWLRWGWECYSHRGYWKPLRIARKEDSADAD